MAYSSLFVKLLELPHHLHYLWFFEYLNFDVFVSFMQKIAKIFLSICCERCSEKTEKGRKEKGEWEGEGIREMEGVEFTGLLIEHPLCRRGDGQGKG